MKVFILELNKYLNIKRLEKNLEFKFFFYLNSNLINNSNFN